MSNTLDKFDEPESESLLLGAGDLISFHRRLGGKGFNEAVSELVRGQAV